jgi:xanthine/uracil permease
LKLFACVLLLSGFFLVLASLVLLISLQQRFAFVAAGFCVEVIGLVLLTQSYKSMTEEQR